MSIVHAPSIVPIALALVLAAGGCDPEELEELEEQDFGVERAGTGQSQDFCARWQGKTIHLYPVGFGTAIRSAEETHDGTHVEVVVHDEQYENPTAENDWLLAYDWTMVSCKPVGSQLDVQLRNESSKEWLFVYGDSRVGSSDDEGNPFSHFMMEPIGTSQSEVVTLAGWNPTHDGEWDPVSARPLQGQGPMRRGELHARKDGCGTAIEVRLAPPPASME